MADRGTWGIRLFLAGAVEGFGLLTAGAFLGDAGLIQVPVEPSAPLVAQAVVPWYGYLLEGLAVLGFALLLAGFALIAGAPAPAAVVPRAPAAPKAPRPHRTPRSVRWIQGRGRPQRGG